MPETKNVVMVTACFPPSNLTAGHRVRLVAPHLPAFGYRPTVLTLNAECYEGNLDPELLALVPETLEVIRTRALPTGPAFRLLGDLGIRSLPFHWHELRRFARQRRLDLLFITVLPGYSSLLGPLIKREFGIPYVIDYQDPWVWPLANGQRLPMKLGLAHWLARRLEPLALASVDGVTAVADRYFDDLCRRHPRLAGVPRAALPLGGEPSDHDYIDRRVQPSATLARPEVEGKMVLAYAGTYWDRAAATFETVLRACHELRQTDPLAADRLRLLFVGTGSRPNDPASGQIAPMARALGDGGWVVEVADRQSYPEALATLHGAHAVMVLGSTDRHYTASKTFQALLSRRPILAVLHAASTAAEMLAAQAGVELVQFTDDEPVTTKTSEIAAAVGRLLRLPVGERIVRDQASFEPLSARAMARRLARLFDDVLGRHDA